MTINELAKMQLIYQYVYMTDNPNNVTQEVKKKLRNKLRKILTNREHFYREAEALKKKVYEEAWHKLFTKGEATYVSLGTFITAIYNSIEKQTMVGHKLMKRMFDSYHHCVSSRDITEVEEFEMEDNATRLANECLKIIDGEKQLSPLARRKIILEQNLIIDGKHSSQKGDNNELSKTNKK